jgi:hypothetical protein
VYNKIYESDKVKIIYNLEQGSIYLIESTMGQIIEKLTHNQLGDVGQRTLYAFVVDKMVLTIQHAGSVLRLLEVFSVPNDDRLF